MTGDRISPPQPPLRRDAVLVIDIEATCWKKQPPPGEQMEIIEVGAVLLDLKTLHPTAARGLLVKPTRSQVSRFCTRLTTLTQAQLDEQGTTFAAACATLERDYAAPARLWMSWGDFDRRMFVEQCAAFGVPYPFSPCHANFKALFGDLILDGKRAGMARSLKIADLDFEGTHHRGVDDAWNIARLLAYTIKRVGSDWLAPLWEAGHPPEPPAD